jgi:lipoprotein-anchoring transpeptidase ErfK/SrfK
MVVMLALQSGGFPREASISGASPAAAAEVSSAVDSPLPASIRPLEPGAGAAWTPMAAAAPASAPAPSIDLAGGTTVGVAPPVPAAAALTWRGSAGRDGYVRAGPTRSAARVGELQPGQSVEVLRWVGGEEVEKENTTWADLGGGRFVYSALLRSQAVAATPHPPADAPRSGRWIDVNLTLQVSTAYDGERPLRSALVSTGRPGWETPRGTFSVQRRVPKETMDGSTLLGQGPGGAGATYRVENVHWTQYFTADGAAIHENYWRNPALFGIPSSHGCIGMRPADAAWFWEFATIDTPIVIH